MMTEASTNGARTWGEKRAVFLGLRDAIRRELETGRSLRAAFVASGADKTMGYSIFTRYVARYLAAESEVQRSSARRASKSSSQLSQTHPGSPAPAPAVAPGYPQPSLSGNQELSVETPKENSDGPKAPPRPEPRRFIRRAGLPDDNKDYLIGPPDDSHDAAT